MTTLTLSQEEIIALCNIIEYASKDISTKDEPLIKELYDKFVDLLD